MLKNNYDSQWSETYARPRTQYNIMDVIIVRQHSTRNTKTDHRKLTSLGEKINH